MSETYTETVRPYRAATYDLELGKANAKRRMHGRWLGRLPVDVSDVEVVSITTRAVHGLPGELEATIVYRLTT